MDPTKTPVGPGGRPKRLYSYPNVSTIVVLAGAHWTFTESRADVQSDSFEPSDLQPAGAPGQESRGDGEGAQRLVLLVPDVERPGEACGGMERRLGGQEQGDSLDISGRAWELLQHVLFFQLHHRKIDEHEYRQEQKRQPPDSRCQPKPEGCNERA